MTGHFERGDHGVERRAFWWSWKGATAFNRLNIVDGGVEVRGFVSRWNTGDGYEPKWG